MVADAAVSVWPQESQNFWPLGFDVPHLEQLTAAPSGTAHAPQNFAPSRFSWPQDSQIMNGVQYTACPSGASQVCQNVLRAFGVDRRIAISYHAP